MTDRGARVKAVFVEALQRPSSERAAFLLAACGADEELRRDVESLATAYEDAGTFLECPAANVLADTGSIGSLLTSVAIADRTERFAVGEVINGRYLVESIVGAGGMGAVYRVIDTASGRAMALKTICGRQAVVDLFKIEFQTLVHLRHPNLAESYDFGPVAGSDDYVFTMELVDGADILDATRDESWQDIVPLLVQLCRVLAYVHSRGIVHRDIKPNNVLVTAGRTVKLVDFGLAGVATEREGIRGTPAYLAPEVMARGGVDHRSDLYSLGVLAYQLVCRRLPFAASGVADMLYQHAYSPPCIPEDVDIPGWLADIVLRLCAKDPADRYRGANQVIEAINRHSDPAYPIETTVTRESYVLSGRFVGRESELETLVRFASQRLNAAVGPSPPVIWIGGQSGFGKSRLVRELRHAVQLDRRTFIEGNCFEGAVGEYGAFAEILAQLVPAVLSNGGGPFVEQYLGDLVMVAPSIGYGRSVPASPPRASAEAERRRLIDSVAAFLVDASRLVPYVLHIGDLHWAPQGTIDILRYVCRRIDIVAGPAPVRIALIGSYRDDEVAARPFEMLLAETATAAQTIALAPLTPPSMRQLLQSMFGLNDIPTAFVERVVAEAAGNPFFLEAVVRTLVERGSVFVEDGMWRTTGAVDDLEIPPTVAATLRRRLEMIGSPEQRRVLQILAAFAKPMTPSLLASVADLPREETREALYALSARRLAAPTVEGAAYSTAHDHVRVAAYADLGPAAPAVHLRIARSLVASSSDRSAVVSEIAHHYWLAAEHEPALRYALLAAERAVAVYANEEAIEHLTHALALLPEAAAAERTQAMERLADTHFLSGHYATAQALFSDLAQRTDAPLEQARIHSKLGETIGYAAGTPIAAVDQMWAAARQLGARRPRSRVAHLVATVGALVRHFVQQAMTPVLPTVHDPIERRRREELIAIYLRISYLIFFGDPILSFLPVFRAANLADRMGESHANVSARSMTAVSFAGLGLAKRARRYGEQAIGEAARLGAPLSLANAYGFHAVVLLQSGEWDDAFDCAERGRRIFAACGDHFQLAVTLYTLLEVLRCRGALAAGILRAREELAVYERLGLQLIGKGPYTVYGQLLAATGDPEGLKIGRDVLERAEHGSDKLSTAFAHIALGDSLYQLGRVDESVDHLERGLAIRDKDRFDVYVVAHGSALLARAYAEQAETTGGRLDPTRQRAFERRVAQAHRAARRFPPMAAPAQLARAVLYRLNGRHVEAAECCRRSATLANRQGARLWEADAYYECARSLLAADPQSRTAHTSLERARSILDVCGANPGAARAARLLTR